MIKLLIVSTVGLKYEGITSVILSNLKVMNLFELEVYVAGTIEVDEAIRKEIENIGCKVIDFPSRRQSPIKYFFKLISFIRKNRIQIVHAHGNSATLAIEMMASLCGGCNVRIAHSHNTSTLYPKLNKVFSPFFSRLYTHGFACGSDAGKWLFHNKPFIEITNGIEVEKFIFNEQQRNIFRKRIFADNKFVVGSVGNFNKQKNHSFLIDAFAEFEKKHNESILLLIGDGYLMDSVKDKVNKLGLASKVHFVGKTTEVNNYMQAMDVFVMPSLHEGFPVALVEAQASGLPCLVSNTVDRKVKITPDVDFLSLTEPLEWSNAIELIFQKLKPIDRAKRAINSQSEINKAGYSIRENAMRMEQLYLSFIKSDEDI